MKGQHVYHLLQYSILIAVFLVTIPILFIVTNFLVKLVIIFGLSFFYLLVGVWHHKEEKKINKTIFLEYLAISLLIFVVLFSLFR